MVTEREEKVLSFIMARGPSLPIDIAKWVGADSFLTSAILSGLVSSGKLKMTSRKIGSSSYYYFPEHELKVRELVMNSLNPQEKRIVEKFKEMKFAFNDELPAQQQFLIKELADLIAPIKLIINGEERLGWKYVDFPTSEIEDLLKERYGKEEKKRGEKKEEKTVGTQKQEIAGFEGKVMNCLSGLGAKIIEKKVARKEAEMNLVIELQTSFGPQKFFAKAKKKKSISESDLSLLGAEGARKKMPVILITNGMLSKKALLFKEKNIGEMIKIINI